MPLTLPSFVPTITLVFRMPFYDIVFGLIAILYNYLGMVAAVRSVFHFVFFIMQISSWLIYYYLIAAIKIIAAVPGRQRTGKNPTAAV